MYGRIDLNGTWQLTWVEGSPLMRAGPWVAGDLSGVSMLQARVPAPVHQVLMENGLLRDLNIGLHSLEARWVEEQFWIYRCRFRLPVGLGDDMHYRLRFDRLEMNARIFLDGKEIGRHANAFRPAFIPLPEDLAAGEHELAVLINAGLHDVSERSGLDYDRSDIGRLVKRHWLRKAQYQCGWDWNARLMNVGILGDVALEYAESVFVDSVSVVGRYDEAAGRGAIDVRVFVTNAGGDPVEALLRARIPDDGGVAEERCVVMPGEQCCTVSIPVDNPRLWWPQGLGEQNLYTVQVSFAAGPDRFEQTLRTGIRSVRIDQSPLPSGGRSFVIVMNGKPVFCKGGNWVPPDLMPACVPAERYERLVQLAAEASFTMLRVWGGGVYAAHALCDACDACGIMIWHDFPFACAKYPGDDPDFTTEVRKEAVWAVRDLARHPSLVVWCGNNEVDWGDADWGYGQWGKVRPHHALFHHELPRIVRRENPAVAWWPASPYSPDDAPPNAPDRGDQHPWYVWMQTPDWREYRTLADRFPNEGGIMGASPPATLRQFLPEAQRRIGSPVWQHHDNPFACQPGPGQSIGRAYAAVQFWTGRDPFAMDWEEYAFVSALLQAEGLVEYISNYRRRKFDTASAIFWMYNDSWPVTHGWTIVDYYLRRKLAYHPVRRAFAPIAVVVADLGDRVAAFGINDTLSDWRGRLRFGLAGLRGGWPVLDERDVHIPANAAMELAQFPADEWGHAGETDSAVVAVLYDDRGTIVSSHRLFRRRFHELRFAQPHIHLERDGEALVLSSDVFVWGVCFDLDGERDLADNCIDLYPGVPRRLPLPGGEDLRVLRIGSRDAVAPVLP